MIGGEARLQGSDGQIEEPPEYLQPEALANASQFHLGFTIPQWPAGKTHTARRTNSKPLGFRTQITVSTEAIKRHLEHTRTIIRAHRARPQRELIVQLSPLIVGWTNDFRLAQQSNRSFARCEHVLTQQLLRWAQRGHPRKGMK